MGRPSVLASDCDEIVGPPDMRPGLCVCLCVCGCAGLAEVLERNAAGRIRSVGRDDGLAGVELLVVWLIV